MVDVGRVRRHFEAHAGALMLYARQWLGAAGAEDVVQDAFVKLLTQSAEPANVRAWLYATVRNAAIDVTRAGQSRSAREMRAARSEWFDARPGDLLDAADAQAALARLGREHREVIVLRVWGGLTLAEVAELVAEPPSTVYSRYRTGLATIREHMEATCATRRTKN